MPVDVIMWPPVGAVGTEWTEFAPVQISRSLLTGAERVSAFQRKRRLVSLSVAGIGKNTYDAGYMEMLKRHLEGTKLVRLFSYPINWHIEAGQNRADRSSQPLAWETEDNPLAWQTGGNPLYWFTGTVLTGSTDTVNGRPVVQVSGLPPNKLVARPGEFLHMFEDWADASTMATFQVTAPAHSNASGEAVIAIFEVPSSPITDARVSIGVSTTGVFRPDSYPRAVQPNTGNWTYDWAFREVFSDEVGGFTEVNPWVL
jgi:hypothetical protein